jgi:hypothetical protein
LINYPLGPALSKGNLKMKVAEGVRFELTRPFGLPVFKTGAINRSATPPERSLGRKPITPLLHYSK